MIHICVVNQIVIPNLGMVGMAIYNPFLVQFWIILLFTTAYIFNETAAAASRCRQMLRVTPL